MADMVADKKKKKQGADMELDMVADMEVDMADFNFVINIDIDINMEIQFDEGVGHGWLIGPNLFRPGFRIFCSLKALKIYYKHATES